MFPETIGDEIRSLPELISSGNKKNIIEYLMNKSFNEMNMEVLKSGYTMIGKHHRKIDIVGHVIKQIK